MILNIIRLRIVSNLAMLTDNLLEMLCPFKMLCILLHATFGDPSNV